MNFFIASTLFAVVILVYWFILELFAMLFRATGLPDDKARFQVLSILTGAGFTTRESEMLISTKARRKLSSATMMFGYVFNVTIVSALVNLFMSLKWTQLDDIVFGNMLPVIIACILIVLCRVRTVRKQIDRILSILAGRIVHDDSANTILLMDYIGHDSIANVILREVPPSLQNLPLSESGLRSEHNIMVMLVERDGYKVEPATAGTVFLPGDRLTVFGNYKVIKSVFRANERFA
ncbi:MAG: TrkA C-terminal domain-containing protein [Eubacterium sp.]|nr:TrkA C-terminal domain-containing protein [Eubacterium sp.]